MNKEIGVLIADPNQSFLSSVAEYFSDYKGVNIVGTASDGMSTLYYALKRRPDIVIVNCFLPHLDGFEVIEELSKYTHLKNTRYILLSSAQSPFIMKLYDRLDIDYMMLKPIDMKSLLDAVHILYN